MSTSRRRGELAFRLPSGWSIAISSPCHLCWTMIDEDRNQLLHPFYFGEALSQKHFLQDRAVGGSRCCNWRCLKSVCENNGRDRRSQQVRYVYSTSPLPVSSLDAYHPPVSSLPHRRCGFPVWDPASQTQTGRRRQRPRT